MRRFIAGVVGSLVVAGPALMLAEAPIAAAVGSVVGMTFDKAKEAVSQSGGTVVTSTIVGDALPMGDCIVTSQSLRTERMFGREYTEAKVLLSLNCNDVLASPGNPGNSAASPAGQEAKQQQKARDWRQTPAGQEWCATALKSHPDWFPLEGCPT